MNKINVLKEENERSRKLIMECFELIRKIEYDMTERDILIKELSITSPSLEWHGDAFDFIERVKRDVELGIFTTIDGKKNMHQIMHEYCRIINFVSVKDKLRGKKTYLTEQSMQSYMRKDTGKNVKKKKRRS